MNKKTLSLIIFSAGILTGLTAAETLATVYDHKGANFVREAGICVRSSDNVDELTQKLDSLCGIKRKRSLARSFRKLKVSERIKDGYYLIKPEYSSIYVSRMLINGWQTPVMVSIAGTIRKPEDLAKRLSSQLMADSASIASFLCDKERLVAAGLAPEKLFLNIIPDSYQFYWTAGVESIFKRLASEADAFWNEERLQKAKSLGLTRETATVLASIVDSETNSIPEMPLIAGVYLNRLAIGMRLQADPTIAYCYGFEVHRILKKMLSFDSPYNTYRYCGLPPGPICLPSKQALLATLNPVFGDKISKAGARGCNLYFCADPSFNGTHRFAKDYGTHLQNAKLFQKALNEKNNHINQ